jgi:hypothetical protein
VAAVPRIDDADRAALIELLATLLADEVERQADTTAPAAPIERQDDPA